jgi:hypothetical protein
MYLSGHDAAGHRYANKRSFNESRTNNMITGHMKVVAECDNFNRSRFKTVATKVHGELNVKDAEKAN